MRPQGWTKSGYYPTPLRVVDLFPNYTRPRCYSNHNGDGSLEPHAWILDPCCGGGEAVATFASNLEHLMNYECTRRDPDHRVSTFGIELNADRATAARRLLTRVWNSDFENTDLPLDTFDVLWLNPPYDWDQDTDHTAINRLESRFLQQCTPALRPDGLLIYIIQESQLARDASYLLKNYYNLSVARFPEPEFADYGQIVIAASRLPNLNQYLAQDDPAIDALVHNATAAHQRVPLILGAPHDTRPDPEFNITLTDRAVSDPSPAVRANRARPEELITAASHEGIWQHRALRQALSPDADNPPIKTLSPLTTGHTMMMMACGALDNVPLIDPLGQTSPILLKGTIKKVTEVTDSSPLKTVETESFSTNIQYLELNTGQIRTIDDSDSGSFQGFLQEYQRSLHGALTRQFPPMIVPTNPKYLPIVERIAALTRKPIGKQGPNAVTMAAHIRRNHNGFIISQSGTGKTFMAIATSAGAAFSRNLVVLPRHVIPRWIEELQATQPHARIRIIDSIAPRHGQQAQADMSLHKAYARCDLQTLTRTPATPERPVWALLPNTTASLGYALQHIVRPIGPDHQNQLYRVYHQSGATELRAARAFNAYTCPFCWHLLSEDPTYLKNINSRDLRCTNCHERTKSPNVPQYDLQAEGTPVLNTPNGNGPRRFPLGDYIAQQMPRWANLLVLDEIHQYKSDSSARGEVIGRLAQTSNRVIGMTGTFIGGIASDVFYLLQRCKPTFQQWFGWKNVNDFVNQYGRYKHTYRVDENHSQTGARTGAQSAARMKKTGKVEIPGYHPLMLTHILDQAVFTTLSGLKQELPQDDPRRQLPPPSFIPKLVPLDSTQQFLWPSDPARNITQADAYRDLEIALRLNAKSYLTRGKMSPLGSMIQELMTWTENAWQGTAPPDFDSGVPILEIPPLDPTIIYPKEQEMINLTQAEKAEQRKFLIFCTHTDTRNTADRTQDILQRHGISTIIMDAKKIKPERRSRWFQDHARFTDGIIVNPKAVETGLDLLDYPTIIWQEIDYSMITSDQASARSNRINQTRPVRIYYLAYANTMQESALHLIASKSDVSRSMYGDLGQNGMSVMNPSGDKFTEIVENQLYAELDRDLKANSGQLNSSVDSIITNRRYSQTPSAKQQNLTAALNHDAQSEPAVQYLVSAELHQAWESINFAQDTSPSVWQTSPVSFEAPDPPNPDYSQQVTWEDLLAMLPERRVSRRNPVPTEQQNLF